MITNAYIYGTNTTIPYIYNALFAVVEGPISGAAGSGTGTKGRKRKLTEEEVRGLEAFYGKAFDPEIVQELVEVLPIEAKQEIFPEDYLTITDLFIERKHEEIEYLQDKQEQEGLTEEEDMKNLPR
jgi:hypothetical protein